MSDTEDQMEARIQKKVMDQNQKSNDLKSILEDKLIQRIALTATILAVAASFSSSMQGYYSGNAAGLSDTVTSNWSYYQANSTKEHIFEMQKNLLEIEQVDAKADLKKKIEEKIKELDVGIKKYSDLKVELSDKNAEIQKQIDIDNKKSGYLSTALIYLQIAIMLTSVGALFKKRMLWIGGLTLGAAGLAYAANGYFLFL